MTVARSGPGVEPATPPVVDSPTEEVPMVETAGGDGPEVPPAPPGRVSRAVDPGLLVHVQAYKGNQERALSLWNTAQEGGLLASALDELADRGYLRGGSGRGEAAVALAGALLVSVAAFDAAQIQHPGLVLDGMGELLQALLGREPVPPVELLEQTRLVGEHADYAGTV